MRNAFLKALGVGGVVVGMTAYVASAQPTLTGMDVGTPSQPGSTTVAGGKITVTGGGNDIWNTSDNFHYAYMAVTGDFDYVVQVESLVGNVGDGGWSKAELMARLDDGTGVPQGSDPFLANMANRPTADIPPTDPLTGTAGVAGVNNRGPQWRAHRSGDPTPDGAGTWSGNPSWTAPTPAYPPNPPNQWLRLERAGNVIYMYTGNDGTTWNMYNPYSPQGWDTAGSWPPGADNPGDSQFGPTPWPAKINLGLAVTAHYDGSAYATNTSTAVFSNFKTYTPVPIVITTNPPAAIAASANSTLTIHGGATGDPVHFQWLKDGNPVSTNGVYPTFTKKLIQLTDSGTYTLRCFGAGQTAVTSTPCVVTITVDTNPPTMTDAIGSASFTEATITFSEPVTAPTATTPGNYSIAGLGTPTAAVLSADGMSVTLTTALQAQGTWYTVTVNNVQDNALNPIAPGSTIRFKGFSFLPGKAVHEQWPDASPVTSLDTFVDARIGYAAPATDPIPPGSAVVENGLETPTWEYGDNYGGRIYGWFMPPTTGDYIFYSTSDDGSYLMLSSDDTPANMRKIANEPSWNNARAWNYNLRTDNSLDTRVGGADATNPEGDMLYSNHSDTWASTEWGAAAPGTVTVPGPIHLTQGNKYYIAGLWKEGGGGDGFGATYRLTTESTNLVADGTASRITGNAIGAYVDTSHGTAIIGTGPVGTNYSKGDTLNFSITILGGAEPMTNQWFKNRILIAGATNTTLTITNADLKDMGDYSCDISNPAGTASTLGLGGAAQDDAARAFMKGATMVIEAEDFNYNGGQIKAAVDIMPYLGDAYFGLTNQAVHDVDYYNTPDNSGGAAFAYSRFDTNNTQVAEMKGGTPASNNDGGTVSAINRNRGDFTVNANYAVGWTAVGQWQNYTRTIPKGSYYLMGGFANDGRGSNAINVEISTVANPTIPNGSVGTGPITNTANLQGATKVGTFLANGTGAWSSDDLIPLTTDTGTWATVAAPGGPMTFRMTALSGPDLDFFVLYTAPAVPMFTGITASTDGSITISWANGTLQVTDDLGKTPISWTDLTVTSPYTFTPTPTQPHLFSRVKGP